MESDKYIVVREIVGDSAQVVIVDVANPNDVLRRPISADSAVMNPNSKILALKCLFKTFQNQKLNIIIFSGQNSPNFWPWSESQSENSCCNWGCYLLEMDNTWHRWDCHRKFSLPLVTQRYKLKISNKTIQMYYLGEPAPVKVFDRHSTLQNTQIINYRSDAEGKFLLLIGISAKVWIVISQIKIYIHGDGDLNLILKKP